MKKKWLPALLQRRLVVTLLIALQAVLLVYFTVSTGRVSQALANALTAISILVALLVASGRGEGAYKLAWVFTILCFPAVGGVLYLFFNKHFSRAALIKQAKRAEIHTERYRYRQNGARLNDGDLPPTVRYLSGYLGFPAYGAGKSTFFPSGEAMLEAMKEDLRRARRYIFMEYFIIEHGEMWNSILEILVEKAKEGVTVRVLYDDLGCFLRLPHKYRKLLKKYGIEVGKFNPFVPFFSAEQNHRDHRKITVVDGVVAYTGGVNLADEYIGGVERFGKWADAAIRVEGGAAWSFTLMFMQMWMTVEKRTDADIAALLPTETPASGAQENGILLPHTDTPLDGEAENGILLPYADTPLDGEAVGEQVYLQIIQNAKRYVYITTPYLILDDKLLSALTLAAKSGVDVRIITPHKWDKKLVHKTTRTYYSELTECGVRLYEYTPGFMHAKLVVCDDEIATVGSVNFDFRSLYLHFECGVYLYRTPSVLSVKDTFLSHLCVCEEIPAKPVKQGFFARLYRAFLRLFAPMM